MFYPIEVNGTLSFQVSNDGGTTTQFLISRDFEGTIYDVMQSLMEFTEALTDNIGKPMGNNGEILKARLYDQTGVTVEDYIDPQDGSVRVINTAQVDKIANQFIFSGQTPLQTTVSPMNGDITTTAALQLGLEIP